jgi:NAD kinase
MRLHHIEVHANPQKPDVLPVARLLLNACADAGLTVALEPWLRDALGGPCDSVASAPDALAVLGGDGTLLRAMPHAAQAGIPLFGVNLGRVGFLTEVDGQADALAQAMQALAKGDYFVEERMLLSVLVEGQPRRIALNDAVIAREACCRWTPTWTVR